ncbi:MAG TPA: D-alanine--D-alanine ligase, partial [Candidatus Saccharimonadales bacterium]|nr:D-alanine--D-alanine ligase [Candidatus Saccharimonadales bacterium]
MSTILVLAGGTSAEREVSLRSGAAVVEALRSKGHTVETADPAQGIAVGSTIDVVFPALHGKGGEDGSIQAVLEASGVRCVGADANASALCFDKWAYRTFAQEHGLPVPAGEMVTLATMWDSPLCSKPFVLKPFDGGSSVDTHIVRDPSAADKAAIEQSFTRNQRMLLEELIEGIEITVGVLGTTVLPAVEIIPPADGEFDYENKYNGKTQEITPPTHITSQQHAKAQELALQAHQLTGCRDLSRTDMIVTPESRVVILETNTLPGMTDQSLFPKAAAAGGHA